MSTELRKVVAYHDTPPPFDFVTDLWSLLVGVYRAGGRGGGGSNLLHTITFDDVSCWLWDYSNTSFFFTFFVSFQSALAESFKFVLG